MTISFSSAGAEPLTVAHRAADPESWPVAVRFDPIDRWYARIAATVEQEVWLLTWLPGQETDLHDHGGSGGGFVVASGALTEETVVGGQLRTAVLDVGNGRQFGARYVHRVGNRGDQPAVSVHVYRPELRRITRYRLEGGQLRVADVVEAGVAW
jgi:hypothetical protein